MKKSDEFDVLDHTQKSAEAADFANQLSARVIGQGDAVEAVADMYQIYRAGLSPQGRPIGTLLFLGPTGSGKTKTIEAAAEVVFGTSKAVVKIDCAEFQHSHEIAKLIGSPPGYLGHRETSPLLTQENLDRCHTEEHKVTFVLFDEIEKASDSLWNLLLGILDKATLTLGDNRRVDFSRTIVAMTSNLGAREMQALIDTKLGFAPPRKTDSDPTEEKMAAIALEAARKRFSPEFMNRIDKVVVFQTLSPESVRAILNLELEAVYQRVMNASKGVLILTCTEEAKDFLLLHGTDKRYNARPLKRAIELWIVLPSANLLACAQVQLGDQVVVDLNSSKDGLIFKRRKNFFPVEVSEPSDEQKALVVR